MRKRIHSNKLWLAGLAGLAGALTGYAQTVVPESSALASTAVDTTKPGFVVRVVQATGAELGNTIDRAESQLAGYLINAVTGLPYANIADLSTFNADGTYFEPGTIAYSAGAFPGIPGTEATTINIALEAITYVQYDPGTYAMVVTGDDGAKLSVGNPYDRLSDLVLVTSPTTSDKIATFKITKAGVYGFRMVYEQGGGGYSVNWYTADPADTSVRTLLNDAGGISCYRALKASVATGPTIVASLPLPNSTGASPNAGLSATIKDGSTALNVGSVKLFYNGTDVTASATIGPKSGTTTKVSYVPAIRPLPLAVEVYKLVYEDPTATGGTREAVISFTVMKYGNYTLVNPIYLETFDSFPEQVAAPPEYDAGLNKWTYHGWTSENYTDQRTPGWDLNDPNSDAFKGWVVISKDRVLAITSWDGSRRVKNVAVSYVNGQLVTTLASTNFFYAESDQRGGSQVQFLYSPDWDLTGKTNVYLAFNSIYEQNQDSMASVEYSIDKGKTWLPILYMVDQDDLKYDANGAIDGYATLSAPQSDTASWMDPNTGQEIGLTYGSFVGITSNLWSTLTPYISGRVNDDPTESKRVEVYRIDKADGQATVRLRFAQAGTGSWYFGIDNVGFYSISANPPVKPKLSIAQSGSNVTLSWSGTGTLLEATAITGPWSNAASQTNPQTITPSGTKFYQVKQ
jgi:hypothetical protein